MNHNIDNNNINHIDLTASVGNKIPESNSVEDIFSYVNKGNLWEIDKEIRKMLNAKSPIKGSLGYLISNHSEYLSFADGVSPKTSQIEKDAIVAIGTRLMRFRSKFYCIEVIINKAPRKNLVLSKKVSTIWEQLCREKIILDPSLTPRGLNITPSMTCNLIKRKLSDYELQLKELLTPIAYLYDIKEPFRKDFWNYPELYNYMEQIIPQGLKGWESDYYYVFSILMNDAMASVIFTESQFKQWNTFRTELQDLLVFLRHGKIADDIFNIFLTKESHVINVPYEKFICLKYPFGPQLEKPPLPKCPNETFSRFVTACSHTVIEMYFVILKHIGSNAKKD